MVKGGWVLLFSWHFCDAQVPSHAESDLSPPHIPPLCPSSPLPFFLPFGWMGYKEGILIHTLYFWPCNHPFLQRLCHMVGMDIFKDVEMP